MTIRGKPLQYVHTTCTAKDAAHLFSSAWTTEVITVMSVFLAITGRYRSFEFFLDMMTTSGLYPKTIRRKPLQHTNTVRSAIEAALVFVSARTSEVLTDLLRFSSESPVEIGLSSSL